MEKCEFCKNVSKELPMPIFNVNVEGKHLYVAYIDRNIRQVYQRVEINYCPMCGIELKEE